MSPKRFIHPQLERRFSPVTEQDITSAKRSISRSWCRLTNKSQSQGTARGRRRIAMLDHGADVSSPMEHAVAEYPVVQGSSPSAGWRRVGRAFTASIASALVVVMVTATPNGANGQTGATPMIPPAVQAVAASGSSKGAPLFVAADPDLVAKEGVAQDSWFVVSHLTSGSNRLYLLVHYIRLTPPQGPVIQAIVSVLDPVSGKSLGEEKDYKTSETTFSAASLEVRTPSGGLTGRASGIHLSGQFSRIQLDLMLAQQGPLLANLGTGLLPFYGDINYEYALPNMKTAGSVVVDGKRYQVDGVSWFDRQWGQMPPSFWAHKQWSWMGISLDNGDRISLWDIIEGDKEHAFATMLHPDGRHEIVDVEPLAEGATSIWKSAATGHRYPTHWVVSIPMLKARLRVEHLGPGAGSGVSDWRKQIR